MQKGPFRVTASAEKYANPWIRVIEDEVIRPDGSCGVFGVVKMKTGSTVLPLTDDGQVWLVSEYKYALGRVSLELMSGGVDEGETPLGAAQRELIEELGLAAGEWQEAGCLNPFTTVIDAANYMFIARELRPADPPPGCGNDSGEIIERVKMPLAEAVELVKRGEIVHGASCVLLLRAALEESLRGRR